MDDPEHVQIGDCFLRIILALALQVDVQFWLVKARRYVKLCESVSEGRAELFLAVVSSWVHCPDDSEGPSPDPFIMKMRVFWPKTLVSALRLMLWRAKSHRQEGSPWIGFKNSSELLPHDLEPVKFFL